MPVTIDIDPREIRDVQKQLVETAKEFPKEMVGAINDTSRQTRTEASKQIRKSLNAKKKAVDFRLKRDFARKGKLRGRVTIKDRPLIPLKAFRPKQTKRGVNIRIRKGASIQKIHSAFIVANLGGHVFRRTGKSRLPIEKLPGVALAAEATASGAVKHATYFAFAKLKKNIQRRLQLAAIRKAKQRAKRSA